jgi:hypothetical protein
VIWCILEYTKLLVLVYAHLPHSLCQICHPPARPGTNRAIIYSPAEIGPPDPYLIVAKNPKTKTSTVTQPTNPHRGGHAARVCAMVRVPRHSLDTLHISVGNRCCPYSRLGQGHCQGPCPCLCPCLCPHLCPRVQNTPPRVSAAPTLPPEP